MPGIDDACVGLAAALNGITGLRAKAYADDITNPPEAQVYSREFDPRMVLGDSKRVFALGVRVFVKASDPRSAQKSLRGYMEPSGSTSVRAAIEDESSWAGVTIDYAEVTRIGQPFGVDQGTEMFWAVDIDVDVCW